MVGVQIGSRMETSMCKHQPWKGETSALEVTSFGSSGLRCALLGRSMAASFADVVGNGLWPWLLGLRVDFSATAWNGHDFEEAANWGYLDSCRAYRDEPVTGQMIQVTLNTSCWEHAKIGLSSGLGERLGHPRTSEDDGKRIL